MIGWFMKTYLHKRIMFLQFVSHGKIQKYLTLILLGFLKVVFFWGGGGDNPMSVWLYAVEGKKMLTSSVIC